MAEGKNSCKKLVRVAAGGMRMITSEHLRVMNERLSNFAYAAVTDTIMSVLGNTKRKRDVSFAIDNWNYRYMGFSSQVTAVEMVKRMYRSGRK